jgi:hypothetical protein
MTSSKEEAQNIVIAYFEYIFSSDRFGHNEIQIHTKILQLTIDYGMAGASQTTQK